MQYIFSILLILYIRLEILQLTHIENCYDLVIQQHQNMLMKTKQKFRIWYNRLIRIGLPFFTFILKLSDFWMKKTFAFYSILSGSFFLNFYVR